MAIYLDRKRKTYYIKYRKPDGTQTTKRGFTTKKAAQEYEFRATHEDAPDDITLAELFDEKIAGDRKRLKETSIISIESSFNHNIKPILGHRKLSAIKPIHIKKWQDSLEEKGISSTSVSIYNNILSNLLKYAVKYHNLKNNPMEITGRTGKIKKRTDFLELEEFDTLMKYVSDPLCHCAFNLLFYSGMRIGEMQGLTRDDINYATKQVSITKEINHVGKVTTPKNASSVRKITLPQFVLDEIKAFSATHDSNYLIPVTRLKLRKYLIEYLDMAGIKHITLHGFRHSHASYLIKQAKDIPITSVTQRLGHSSAQTTLSIYAHFYKDGDDEIAKFLENEKQSGQNVVTDKK